MRPSEKRRRDAQFAKQLYCPNWSCILSELAMMFIIINSIIMVIYALFASKEDKAMRIERLAFDTHLVLSVIAALVFFICIGNSSESSS